MGQAERILYPHASTGVVGGGGIDQMVYDAAGNLKRTAKPVGFVTLMYRDPLGRVRETISPVHAGSSSDSASAANTGVRQDALDRRVLVRTRRVGLCYASTANASTVDCTSGIERFVRSGNNILWEMRGPGANGETAERLEQVSIGGVEFDIVG